MKTALKNLDRTFGVELEIIADRYQVARAMTNAGLPTQYEGYNHTTRNAWKVVYDASVSGGCEVVSPKLKGIDGLNQIETVCNVLNELGATVNRSCGLHVHHDAKGFKFDNLKRIVHLYGAFESEFDKMMPASRRGTHNNFLQPVASNGEFSAYNADRVANAQNVSFRSDCRYHKININAFHQHGTVEFRHHSGTVDFKKICAWVILTQRMMERCKGVRKAPAKTCKQWRDVLGACGIANVAMDKLDPAEAELVKYTIERREYFRTQTREQARRATRSTRRSRVA